jgi:MFS family permease
MPQTVTTRTADPAVTATIRATYVAFIFTGFSFASWASRIPQVRDRLHLNPAQLGLVLLAIAAGSLISLPLSGTIVGRYGSRLTVTVMALINAAALAFVGIGYQFGVIPLVIGLFGLGFGQGAWDVAVNVQGNAAERRLGRAIMSRVHAGFSVGTVAGALIGAVMVALGVPVTVHLVVAAALIAGVVPVAVRSFLPDRDGHQTTGPASGSAGRSALSAWLEPRTCLIGLFVLAFAFAEGTGNDWTSVAFIDGYQTSPAIGTLGLAVFLSAMTLGRWFGPPLLDRYGRVPVVRWLAILGIVGVVLFIAGAATPVGFAGSVLWGAGVSLGFPVGMSAAGDDPGLAAPRVSVVASIGYCAFLAGPPLIGFLGDHMGVLRAFSAVAVLLGIAALLASSVRPLAPAGRRGRTTGGASVNDS